LAIKKPVPAAPGSLPPDFTGKSLDDDQFPPGDLIPPVLLAASTRALYDLIASASLRRKPGFPRIEKALSLSSWRRRNIYLTRPSAEGEDYEAVFRRFLDGGFLIPPSPMEPLILPAVLSPGEEAKLARLLGSM
jgi:hypothetical protein